MSHNLASSNNLSQRTPMIFQVQKIAAYFQQSALILGDLDVRLNDRDLEGDRSIVCYSLSIHPPKSCHFFSRYPTSLSDF
jgi:hypothetical protein